MISKDGYWDAMKNKNLFKSSGNIAIIKGHLKDVLE